MSNQKQHTAVESPQSTAPDPMVNHDGMPLPPAVEAPSEIYESHPGESIINGIKDSKAMTKEEFENVVEIFRLLKKWRDEASEGNPKADTIEPEISKRVA